MKKQCQRLVRSRVPAQVIRFSVALALMLMPCARFVGGRAFGQTQPARDEHTARPDNINNDFVKAMTLQPDGKIIVAGITRAPGAKPGTASGNGPDEKTKPKNSKGDFALVRYLADGGPDTSFGEEGKVVTDFGGNDDDVAEVVLQADGKILLVGTTKWDNCDYDFALARYNSDGALDASFGRGGKVVTDFFGKADLPFGVVIQPDGRIVVAGKVWNGYSNLALARYTPQGALDSTFGDGGKVVTPSSRFDFACSLSLRNDGKILVAGGSAECSPNGVAVPYFTLMRYHNDGRLERAYGDKGALNIPVKPPAELPNRVVFQPDGEIILASYPVLLRFSENGLPNSSFGINGVARTRLRPGVIALLPDDGFILAGGGSGFSLVRYNRTGEVDLRFGAKGRVDAPRGVTGSAMAIAIQSDGKIIVGGFVELPYLADFLLRRYNEDGTLDTAFGNGGQLYADFNGITDKTPALDFKQNPQSAARKCPEYTVVSRIIALPAEPVARSGGGMGTGDGGGLGPGNGRGVGPGNGYNMGGGDLRLGGGNGATNVDDKPVLLNKPQPGYTEEARKNKIQGVVSARVLVGADGQVKQVKITRGLPDGLDEQAIKTAYQYRFKPALKDGKPVAYWLLIRIEFNLR